MLSLTRRTSHYQGEEFIKHFKFKMGLSSTDVLLEFPPPLDIFADTSVAQAKYSLTGAYLDLAAELNRYFDIPALNFLENAARLRDMGAPVRLQPSLNLISSKALINLAKALIKIIGEDQVAFALWERSPESKLPDNKRSYLFSHKVFVWPCVFVSFSLNYIFSAVYRELICLFLAGNAN